MLPKKARENSMRPCVAITITSAERVVAAPRIAVAGLSTSVTSSYSTRAGTSA
jgi:hypothetical protein